MDNLIKGAVNKIKQFATTTFKQAPQALQNYATAYGKVSPYIPFAPKLQTPQQVKQNYQNIGNTYNKLPTPVKKFGEGFVESSTLGLYDMPAQKSQSNLDRAGYVGGYVAGIVNPLNPANKIFGALNIGEKIAAPAISKIAPKATGFIATKLLPNIAGEATQTAGYMALKNLSERTNLTPKSEGNFGEQLAYGLLGRGAFGVIGKNLPGQLKVQAGKIGDDDVKALGAIMKRATTNWTDGNKINLNQYSKDINLVDEILVSKYGATKEELKKIPEIDRIKNLFSMAMEDYRGYQIKGNNLVSGITEQPAQKIKVTKDGKIKVTPQTPELTQPKIETDSYIAEQLKKQQEDARSGPQGIMEMIKKGLGSFKRQWVEAYSPLIDPVNEYARKNKAEILPTKNIDDQISRVLASDTIAARWLKDNGFEGVVGKDRDLLGQYLIARDNITGLSRQGKLTGRDFNKDMQFVQSNPQFEERANQVTAMYKQLAQMAEDNGLLPKGTVDKLVAQNPNYVRWERIFNPDEKSVLQGSGKAVASLSKQSVVQSMKGSERAIENPLVSVINRAYKTFNEIERNKAADILTTYRNIPGNPYGLRKLGPKENVGTKSTISVIKNGVKEIWEVEKEVAEAAKNLNKEQMSTWVKVITAPVRLFKAGTTTLRIPFIATNIAKDQLTAFINSERAASTSLMNPKNALESLWESVGHGNTFKELERSGSMGTSFDIYREQPRITLEEIAAKKELGSRILYKITHPEQLLRSYENIVSRGEEFTRIQQFKGTYDALIKEGRTVEDATILAARAARQNTVDFNRFGELSRVLNWVIPYFNAGIQGSRSFLRSAQRNPVGTGAKMVAAVFTPMVASTMWNMATPDRREAYNDIQDYEKENNFIIIPPNPQKDAQGRWNVIKIPLSQEVANLANISRLYTLQAVDGDRVAAGDVAADLIGATTSLDIKNPVNQFMPQPLKPVLEVVTNKNLYTGKDIVPSYMKGKPKEEQAYKFTSGTARALGKATNLSPLQAQHLVKGYLGSTGTDIMGQIDRTLADKGIIPKEQAGGMDIVDATTARFTKASGGKVIQDAKESADKGWSPRLLTAYDYLHSSKTLDENGLPAKNRNESMAFAQIRLANPQILAREAQEARLKAKMEGGLINPLYELPFDKQRVVLTLASLPPGQDKSDLQKANIDWLKQYWAENSVFFNKLKASGVQITDTQRGPVASPYVQAQMDAQNWKDPQVRAYLDANLAYKNKVREELGLTPLASGFSKFPAYVKKPKKVALRKVKKGKTTKFKTISTKVKKLKTIKGPTFKAVKTKQPKIKVKMPKIPKFA